MKRLFICIVAILVAFAFATSVLAYPNLTEKTGKPCAYCHKTPSGGKDLTSAGQYYKKNNKLPPAAKSAAKAKPAPKAKPSKKAGAGKGPSTTRQQRAAAQQKRQYREVVPLK